MTRPTQRDRTNSRRGEQHSESLLAMVYGLPVWPYNDYEHAPKECSCATNDPLKWCGGSVKHERKARGIQDCKNGHQYVTDYQQHEYFQVYSLLSSRLATLGGLLEDAGPGASPHGYSEKRFANKIIAITGCMK